MRTRYQRLAVAQAEDRCLPSAPMPVQVTNAYHRLALPGGLDRPRDPARRDVRAGDERPDWFGDDTDRLDNARHGSDEWVIRADDRDESFGGRPAFVEQGPSDAGRACAASPITTSEITPSIRRPVPLALAGTAAAAAPIVGRHTDGLRVGTNSAESAAPFSEDPAARPRPDDAPDRPSTGCPVGDGVAIDIAQTVAVAVGPVAGCVPFGLPELQEEVGRLLAAVSDVEAAELPAWDEGLWVGTAVLVAGGAAHVAYARPVPRPPADPRTKVPARLPAPDGR